MPQCKNLSKNGFTFFFREGVTLISKLTLHGTIGTFPACLVGTGPHNRVRLSAQRARRRAGVSSPTGLHLGTARERTRHARRVPCRAATRRAGCAGRERGGGMNGRLVRAARVEGVAASASRGSRPLRLPRAAAHATPRHPRGTSLQDPDRANPRNYYVLLCEVTFVLSESRKSSTMPPRRDAGARSRA